MIFKLGELFCGPGGLSAGAFKAETINGKKEFKIIHEWSADYDADSCETYRKNFCKKGGLRIFAFVKEKSLKNRKKWPF